MNPALPGSTRVQQPCSAALQRLNDAGPCPRASSRRAGTLHPIPPIDEVRETRSEIETQAHVSIPHAVVSHQAHRRVLRGETPTRRIHAFVFFRMLYEHPHWICVSPPQRACPCPTSRISRKSGMETKCRPLAGGGTNCPTQGCVRQGQESGQNRCRTCHS